MALGAGFTARRRLADAAEGLGTSAVVLALVAAVVYAATRPAVRLRVDLTEQRQYTLSEQTRSVLGGLEESVHLVSIMRPEDSDIAHLTRLDAVQIAAAGYVNLLLEQYALASRGRASVEILDPYADDLRVKELVRRHHLGRYNLVLVQGAERTEQVMLEEMVTIDQGRSDPALYRTAQLLELRAEAPLTSALLSVMSDRPTVVGFLVGLGGPLLDDIDSEGLARYVEAVRGQGLEVRPVDLSRTEGVPGDTDVLVLCGPTRPLGSRFVSALREFQGAGGALLLFLDPTFRDEGLDVWLGEIGLRREPVVVCRTDRPTADVQRVRLVIRDFLPHAVTDPIRRQGIFASMPATGGLARSSHARPEVQTHPLARTEPTVFGDTVPPGQLFGDFAQGEGETQGARVVAYALEGGPGGRAVVFANSRFLINAFLASDLGGKANMDLGLNAVNWLAGREEAVAVRPRSVIESRVDLMPGERTRIWLYVVVLMPLAGALLGGLVRMGRNRAA